MYSYGLASSKEVTIYDFAADTTETSGLSVFDFNAQTFFADARWERANWIVDAGFDYRRLMDSSRYEQFYAESVPRWGVRRIIPTSQQSALSLGYEGDYRFTSTDLPPEGLEEDYGDRTDHSLIVAYSFSLCEHAVLQPYYRFQYTWFTAGESRTDYLNTFGLALYCPITPNFSARLFISQDLLETTSRLVPDYHKLDTGAGLTLTLRLKADVRPHCPHVMSAPRIVALPVVGGVGVVIALVATYTCAMLPWLTDYCEFYQRGNAVQLAGITRAFLRLHLIGVPLGLAILGYGVRLLWPAETSAAHLAWYASVSVSIAAVWQTWAMLVERSLYVLLFPA